MIRRAVFTVLLAAALIPWSAARTSAATPAAPRSTLSSAGDLAVRLGCVVCHGQRGQAPLSNIPSLAGQRPEWLKSQLETFRHEALTGGDGLMPRYARNLTDAQILTLAGAYSRDPDPVPARDLAPALVAEGRVVYEQGRPAARVLACATCHGAVGEGTTTPLIPALTGQHAGYVTYRLGVYRHLAVKQGQPGAQAMRTVARSLSDADVRAVAAYVEQLPAGSFR
jgi:cytochrome c553